MILTWFVLWPLLVVPSVVLFLLGALPTVTLLGQSLGGFLLREFLLQQAAVLIPAENVPAFYALYFDSDLVGQLLMHLWLSVNVNVALLPLLYLLGAMVISFNARLTASALTLKTKTVRR